MKRLKRIGIIALIAFMVIPTMNVFAYNGGLLDGKELVRGDNIYSNKISYIFSTDGDVNTTIAISPNGTTGEYAGDTLWYKFASPVNIDSFRLLAASNLTLEFYDVNGNPLYKTVALSDGNEILMDSIVDGVSYVSLHNTSSSNVNVNEFDVFEAESDTTPPSEVTNIKQGELNGNLGIDYDLPNDSDLDNMIVYRNGTLFAYTTYDYYYNQNFVYGDVIKVTTVDTSGNESTGKTITLSEPTPTDTTAPTEVTNVNVTNGDGQVTLDWTNPTNEDFKEVNIYRNDQLAYTVTTESWTDTTVENDQEYTYKLTTVDTSGNESSGVTVSATPITPDTTAPQELTVTEKSVTDTSITYSFTDVASDTETINVYQNGQLIDSLPSDTSSYKINSLQPETTYIYTFSAVDAEGNESSGISVTSTTDEPPMLDLSNVQMPFTVKDMVIAGMDLLWIVGPFVLLSLAFIFVPKIKEVIVESFKSSKTKGR